MKKRLLLALVLAFAAVLLNVIVLISSDPSKGVIRKLNWSYGTQKQPCSSDGCHKIYVGVTEFETVIGSFSTTTEWSSSECSASFCSKCEDTMKVVLAFAALCIAFSFPTIFINCCRKSDTLNSRCLKYTNVTLSFLAVACGVVAVVSFSQGCQKKVKDYTNDVITWHYGSAWILMVTVTALKFADFLLNLMVPYVEMIRI